MDYVVYWTAYVEKYPSRSGYSVVTAPTAREARSHLRRRVDLHLGERLIVEKVEKA